MTLVGALLLAATVVLDPGHGGVEDGARTAAGAKEKNVALAISRRAAERLRERGVTVVLTRRSDVTTPLSDRLAVAHRTNAAAFVSIHLNASGSPGRRGVETYVASVLSSTREASALVSREEAGLDAPRPASADPLETIIDDLENQAAHRRSADLAAAIQAELGQLEPLGPSRGLRQAPFYLLQNARVPSVLVEAGYASHAEQGRYLSSATGQQQIGDRLAAGILRYLGE